MMLELRKTEVPAHQRVPDHIIKEWKLVLPDEEDEEDAEDDEDEFLPSSEKFNRPRLKQSIEQSLIMHPVCDQESYGAFSKAHYFDVSAFIKDDETNTNSQGSLLHFVLTRVDEMETSHWKLMTKLVLDVARDMGVQILCIKGGTDSTCLHEAIRLNRSTSASFIKFICTVSHENDLQDAIATTNNRGQNCLHAAIAQLSNAGESLNFTGLEILAELVSKARRDTLGAHRPLKTGGGDAGVGNLPLHDLVHINLCKGMVRRCPNASNSCDRCRKRDPEAENKRYRKLYLETLDRMAEKWPRAVKEMNDAKQSPFLYHIFTRRTNPKTSAWENLEFLPANFVPAEENKTDGPPKDRPREEVKAKDPKDRFGPGPGPGPEDASRRKARDKDRSDHGGGGARQGPGSKGKDKVEQGVDKKPSSTSPHIKDEVQFSKALAIEVSRRLLELSLSQQTFGDSCDSLFGEKFPSSELIFKSAPLTDKTTITHSALPLESMLACVEIVLKDNPADAIDTSKLSRDAARKMELEAREQREERVKDFFEWLRTAKKVRRIVKLVVNDHETYPCRNDTIKACLKGFDVRYLDWDKQDLSINTLAQENIAPNLQELWLSWSGRDSVLFGWSNPEHGLGMLKKLRAVYISPNSAWEDDDTNDNHLDMFKKIVRKHMPKIAVKDAVESYYGGHDDTATRLELTGAPKHGNDWLDAVATFKKALRHKLSAQERKMMHGVVKIALIDDGVDLEDLETTEFIVGGWHADRKGQHKQIVTWYQSEKKHGTEMARLMQRVWPYTSIYVAKLDTGRRVFKSVAASAAAAIDKAIENGCNVISMSWTMYPTQLGDNNDGLFKLKKAIERAGQNDIIMFCASEDGGYASFKSPYPATDCDQRIMKRIGSAGTYGERSDYVNPAAIDYLFPGEIAMPEGTDITGSSAATALAAGLAGLILWCGAFLNMQANSAKGRAANAKMKSTTTFYSGPSANNDTVPTPTSDRPMGDPFGPLKRTNTKLDPYATPTNGPASQFEDNDFQSHARMYGLYDALRSSKENPLVNIAGIMIKAANSGDPAREFIELCKKKAHEFFEQGTMASPQRR